jgi:hypothetical protein
LASNKHSIRPLSSIQTVNLPVEPLTTVLQTELQHLASAVTPRKWVADTELVGCAADPLLLDEVYTCTSHQRISTAGSSHCDVRDTQSSSGPSPKDRTSNSSFTRYTLLAMFAFNNFAHTTLLTSSGLLQTISLLYLACALAVAPQA